MDRLPRLTAYGWDIAGSLAGIVVFVVSSQLRVPPWVWPPVLALGLSVLLVRSLPARVGWVSAGCLFLTLAQADIPARWSPYYYVQYQQEQGGLRVFVNSSFHQFA